ncbi:hypothetical protein [Geomicrobium sp. JCM 19039]|uniref:hypothetical protein n=1 Tax=Geomicrobium sp. JCM 19039 TaxID=1460636 RepID=UPI00045F1056|nr:hypothetical protein [Geomicrobium sp. JCM 19039]GAK13207.1 hypothetical protein JCM19039_3036 [Geomicrobium sp. JCM 19039]
MHVQLEKLETECPQMKAFIHKNRELFEQPIIKQFLNDPGRVQFSFAVFVNLLKKIRSN